MHPEERWKSLRVGPTAGCPRSVAAPVLEVHGVPGGLPRVGVCAQPTLRQGPSAHAASQHRLRCTLHACLPHGPGHGCRTRAGGRHCPEASLAPGTPPDRGVSCLQGGDGRKGPMCCRPSGTQDGGDTGRQGHGLMDTWPQGHGVARTQANGAGSFLRGVIGV